MPRTTIALALVIYTGFWLLVGCDTAKTPVEILGINDRTIGGPTRSRLLAFRGSHSTKQTLWLLRDHPEASDRRADICITIENLGTGGLRVGFEPLFPEPLTTLRVGGPRTVCSRAKEIFVICDCRLSDHDAKPPFTCEGEPGDHCDILWRIDDVRSTIVD